MPRIAQYYADDKITPVDTGVSAWETAGRRIGPLYSQIADNDRELSKSIAQLWTEDLKFGLDQMDHTDRGGGGFKVKGGGGSTLLGTGSISDRVNNSGVNAPGQYVRYQGPNIQAQSDITRGAASIGDLTARLAAGQGLTDVQYGQLAAEQAKQKAPGYTLGINNNPKTGGIAPNLDVTYDEAAKAGFNTGTRDMGVPGYGTDIPSYPPQSNLTGGPSAYDRDSGGNTIYTPGANQETPAAPAPVNANPVDITTGMPLTPTDGYSIWGAITNALAPAPETGPPEDDIGATEVTGGTAQFGTTQVGPDVPE